MKNLGTCHSDPADAGEKSKFLIPKQCEMLRFAQHDIMGDFFIDSIS